MCPSSWAWRMMLFKSPKALLRVLDDKPLSSIEKRNSCTNAGVIASMQEPLK